ncbi:dihydrolipoyllysine-residue acetyltransferase [Alteromonas ponticola]|uniref:Dihydrolipoamide acetyltransferase component of pyruvate dehydrogenase complex n=1 Tax=Alteromonas aquimaris TaxID=2998417 RepID=A0ABT3P6S9_9ALTE|nr:dihydrolipoyllysine-residue acetyltransferase [Alteromonas aquimaris]MCW8108468.1 dihydrolipoyllysine-residue acetyltransferase [Alteromonas aquimaris]
MTTDFILPDIGEGIVECELLEWLVEEGQHIQEDQPVAEVMTDKATVQIPAMHSGTVKKLHYKVGEIAKVHSPLFAIDIDAEEDTGSTSQPASEAVVESNEKPTMQPQSTASTEDFILPDIGEGIVECEIVKWHVSEGDVIAEDQPVVEVMTDKAVVEIPAKHAGKVARLYHQQGDIAKVHEPLFALEVEGGSDTAPQKPVQSQASSTNQAVVKSAEQRWPDGAYEPPVTIPGKVLASPAVRRIAREQDIDLTKISGSGKKGRILKVDVQNVKGQADTTSAPSRSSVSTDKSAGTNRENRTEKVRGIQAAMAKQMSASVYTIPHFTVSDELRMDALIALRQQLKPVFEKQGVKLSFMPFFAKALSLALNEFPIINSQLNEDATELTYFSDHNIGFAVDSKIGLLVPNIKGVQNLSLLEIAEQMQGIIDQAREGRLGGESLKGGTISISNIGAIGGMTATPVINKPEAAIVALGKTQALPRFNENDEVEKHHIMQVNWSGDHRIIDGATMVRFNNLFMSYLTNPSTMLMHLR